MKFVLVVVAVAVLLWLLRGTFESARKAGGRVEETPAPMLACAQCGVHLPANEALPGRGGVFCGDAHRSAFEAAHPE